jgi:putative DNA primase/helicase
MRYEIEPPRNPFARDPGPSGRSRGETPARGNGHDAKARIRPAELTKLRDLKMEKINWLWDGWLARGEVCLIAGIPEAGKTTCSISIAAILSSGGRWPDETLSKPGNVIVWTGEDTAKTVIGPRLVQMGADIDRVDIVTGQRDEDGTMHPFNPSKDLPGLTLAAKELPGGCDLLIIDPIVAAIGGKVDNGNNAGHREKLQPLVDFAKELNCAVLGVTHFSKGSISKDPIDRVTGSLAFAAVARTIMVATKNKCGEPQRMFLQAKNNLSEAQSGFGYEIQGSPLYDTPDIIASRVVWGERLEGTARELLAQAEDDGQGNSGGQRRQTSAQDAVAFLASALARGERPQADIAAEAEAVGISKDRLFHASKKLNVAKRKIGIEGGWSWKLR